MDSEIPIHLHGRSNILPGNEQYQGIMERMKEMMNNERKQISEGSVVLYGVPKVHYGAFGGCTPYPISLKSVANYMGIDLVSLLTNAKKLIKKH